MKAVIVDDEPLARSHLRRLLAHEGDVEILAECEDGPSAVTALHDLRPDVVFLDIRMPGMDGFGVLDALPPDRIPWTIFVTAYDEHAVQAFEKSALDYLLKPISRARVQSAVARLRTRLTSPENLTRFTEWLAERAASRRLAIPEENGIRFIPVDEVDWIESAGNYAVVHVGNTRHILRETLNELEKQLPEDQFARVSRGAIVNLRRVQEIQSTDAQIRLLLTCGTLIPSTRSRRELTRLITNQEASP
jgi:two-component system LytT family response regulator